MYKKTICLIIILTCWLTSCKQVNVDFSYEPANPKAGEKVVLTNLSTGGEEWLWNFGNNQTATTGSTSVIYKQTGTYLVSLLETKSGKKCIKTIEVSANEPYITASADTICMFKPVTLYIKTWNPYDHFLAFEWMSNSGMRMTGKEVDKDSLTVVFTKAGEVVVEVDVMTDEEINTITHTFDVKNTPAPAILMKTNDGKMYFQRFYNEYMEDVREVQYDRGTLILDTTVQRLTAIDKMERKTYTGSSDGLTVSNENGENSVKITDGNIRTLVIATSLNRLFYSTGNGVYTIPLVHTYNNQTDDLPEKINHLTNINYINIDYNAF